MALVEGQVSKISAHQTQTGMAFSFALANGDKWYRIGFNEPKFKEGYYVRFDDTPINKYQQIDIKTMKYKEGTLVNNQSAGNVAQSAGKKNYGSKKSQEEKDFWNKKNERDVINDKRYNYRSAYYLAVEMVSKGIELDILSLGTASASRPKKWEAYQTYVNGLAADLMARFMAGGAVPNPPQEEPEAEPVPEPAAAQIVETEPDGWTDAATSDTDTDWSSASQEAADEWKD